MSDFGKSLPSIPMRPFGIVYAARSLLSKLTLYTDAEGVRRIELDITATALDREILSAYQQTMPDGYVDERIFNALTGLAAFPDAVSLRDGLRFIAMMMVEGDV